MSILENRKKKKSENNVSFFLLFVKLGIVLTMPMSCNCMFKLPYKVKYQLILFQILVMADNQVRGSTWLHDFSFHVSSNIWTMAFWKKP